MAQLCIALSGLIGRKVVDRTEIPGMFDIRLDLSGGDLPTVPAPPPSSGALLPARPDPGEMAAGFKAHFGSSASGLSRRRGPVISSSSATRNDLRKTSLPMRKASWLRCWAISRKQHWVSLPSATSRGLPKIDPSEHVVRSGKHKGAKGLSRWMKMVGRLSNLFHRKEQGKASCKYDLATRRRKQSQIDLIGGDSVVPSVGCG